ncbi:hypothetical protein M433DRAFT_527981 [Acidomyces richmondensis BFW]|nr:hypothetical protein M433DRAFT_527981 [Acidomyces richmondensis BFW]
MEEHPDDFHWDKILLLPPNILRSILYDWIHAICPHKRSKCPYATGNSVSDVPEWWPNNCKYISPGSLGVTNCLKVAIHILRWRPTLDTLKKWNEDPDWNGGSWTEYLKSCTSDKGEEYRHHLQDVYNFAKSEETSKTAHHCTSGAVLARLVLQKNFEIPRQSSWIDLGKELERIAMRIIQTLPIRFCCHVLLIWLRVCWPKKWENYVSSRSNYKKEGGSSNQATAQTFPQSAQALCNK